MARSVSTHLNAYETVYLNDPSGSNETDGDDWAQQDNWHDFVDNLRDTITEAYPSFYKADRWLDREGHIILENSHAEVSVSEYCGLVAVCIAPQGESSFEYEQSRLALAEAWTRRVADKFAATINKAFSGCALQSLGRASNGEQFFRLATAPESLITSKEGQLW